MKVFTFLAVVSFLFSFAVYSQREPKGYNFQQTQQCGKVAYMSPWNFTFDTKAKFNTTSGNSSDDEARKMALASMTNSSLKMCCTIAEYSNGTASNKCGSPELSIK
jgi:hypothetical protein